MRRLNSAGAWVLGVLASLAVIGGAGVRAQSAPPDWRAVEEERLRH